MVPRNETPFPAHASRLTPAWSFLRLVLFGFELGLALQTMASWASGAEGMQLMRPEKLAAIKASLPRVAAAELRALLDDPRTLWYTNDEIPPAYQFAQSGVLTNGQPSNNGNAYFLDVRWNISGDAREASKGHGRGGNGNVEFPWRTPGGLDLAEPLVTTVRFMHLPAREDGSSWPVVAYRDLRLMPNSTSGGRIVGGLNQSVLAWTYPTQTTFGEVLYQKRPDGAFVAFEIRTRTKRGSEWEVDIQRPFPRATDLVKGLRERGQEDLAGRVETAPVVLRELVDRHHPTRAAFAMSAGQTSLPAMGEPLVNELLTETPFKSALGVAFKSEGSAHAFTPTAESYSIVPANYTGSFLGTDSTSCMNCHQHTLAHVNQFDLGRDWYGYVRGSDGIFTFHPVEPASVQMRGQPSPVRLRQSLVNAGLVETYNADRHPSSVYLQTKGLLR